VVFGRKRRQVEGEDVDVDSFVDDLEPEDRAMEDAELERELALAEEAERRAAVLRPQGPWDLADAPEEERPLDLGALQLAATPDVEVRVEVSGEGDVVAVVLVSQDSSAQVNVFAAPRSEGIWREVREEIAEALRGSGGRAEEAEGVLGTELRAEIPQEVPGQGVLRAPARFVGVDGPRWFLRGLLTGPAATDDTAAAPLLDALRRIVVVRGTEPMPARDPLPLVLPAEAAAPEEVEPEQDGDEGPRLSLPERGPEITEVR
jgi:hypothetical protein